jgi:sulfate/thiosulfate transport system substrate-binding protein
MKRTFRTAAVAGSVASLLALAACGDDASAGAGDGGGSSIDLVAYSTPESAYNELEGMFQGTGEGEGVEFSASYGPSGDQSRAVEAGQPADYVNFSLESDVTRLVDAGLVAEDWNQNEHDGIVADSVVVIVTRPGNPLGIEGWEDLVEPGVEIVTPNPGSSGGARWNILAAWGHVIATGGSEKDAEKYLTQFFENTVALPGSARDALTSFTSGNGDVLISYENEAILARQNDAELDYVVPQETLLIETPAAVTESADEAASAWLDFLWTEEAQAVFRTFGYRPVVEGIEGEVEGATDPADPFPTPETLLTVGEDFGGWPEAGEKFFEEETGIVPQIQAETGATGE